RGRRRPRSRSRSTDNASSRRYRYKLIGEKTLQCVEVGDKLEWHKSPPFCHRIRCYDPPTILFGSHSGQPHEEYFYGSTVTYTCNANFSLIGSPTSTCSDSLTSTAGVWLPAPPRCRAIRCDREPEIPNGRVVKKPQRPYTYGVRVTFVCDPGYVMVGQDTCTCGPDHGWIPRFPKCVRGGGEADDAGEEDAIDPGAGAGPQPTLPPDDIETDNIPIIVGCILAVLIVLALVAVFWKYRSSMKTGFRTSSEFLFPSDCTHPHVANATLRSGDPKDSYPAGTVLRYRCIAGYDPIPGETLFLTCLDTSKWSIENPRFCQGQLCPPVNIANGRVVIPSGGRLGDEITLGCIQGYKLVGERTLRCVEVAGKLEWHKPPPICRRIRCYDPPTILFGSHSGRPHEEYFYGSTVTYTCNANFSLIGSTTSTCSDSLTSTSGVWLPAPPRCRVIRCDREPEIPNGRVIKKPQRPYTYGVRVTFVCDPGYVMVGQDTCTCGPDHGWIPRFPKCVRGPGTVPPGDNTGPTHNPETPAGDDTESEYTTATIIGCLTVLMVVVVVVAGMWKIRSYMKTGEAETLSRSGRFDMSVAKSGLEPKGYKNPSLLQ
ncbi:membrane cofactor protein, partial [Zootoca vivipara]|uniref:membrane cofactor protein n=1 Tax=Zootoca vivipara TaxID=8524 RepID=UPI00293BAB13